MHGYLSCYIFRGGMMRNFIYEWMKNLAFFYIILNTFLHLIPEKNYEKYIRFFMGIVLIIMLCTPIFSFLGSGEKFGELFNENYDYLNERKEMEEYKNIQEYYLQQSFLREAKEGDEDESKEHK